MSLYANSNNYGQDDVIRLEGMRGMIARKMQKSLQTAAQLSYHSELDATNIIGKRNSWKASGINIGYEDLIAATMVDVLRDHPHMNGRIEQNEIHFSSTVHISFAIATKAGLMAPTLFNVEEKSLHELAEARIDLISRAKNGKLSVDEMTGGTFTISNLGQHRIKYFTPIINTPQIAILGLGQITSRPWVDAAGDLIVKPVLGLSLTTDHRIVDGEPSAAFLTDLCEQLERPD